MQAAIASLIKVSRPAIITLNLAGELVGAIWLLFLGEWRFVVSTFITSLFIPWVLSIPLVVVSRVSCGIVWLLQNTKIRMLLGIGSFLASFFQHLLYVAWIWPSGIDRYDER